MTYLFINIGNFHPVLVHMPIGILMFAFVLEIYQRVRPAENLGGSIKLALGFGVLSALAAIGTGLLLEENGAYDEELLFRHKWMAISLTVVSIIIFFAKESKKPLLAKLYFPLFIVVNIMLVLAGHWGGSMTHGEDFLTKAYSSDKNSIVNVDEAIVYQDIVRPILDAKCISCHNAKKAEGNLLMTSRAELLAGGDTGNPLDSVLDLGKPLMAHRMALPLEDEEHMPPKGKVQLTPNEIALLNWWMENKNCFECKTVDLDRNKKIQAYLNDLEVDTSTRSLLAKSLEPPSAEWLAEVAATGTSIYPLKEGSPLYIVYLANKTALSEAFFDVLDTYSENIVELNLGNSNFNDTLVSSLRAFENLTKLQLQNTAITDKGFQAVAKLDNLESLNLYGTSITDAALEDIKALSKLTDLYLWKTGITDEALRAYAGLNPSTTVHSIDMDMFSATELLPPTILADNYFIKDTVTVEISYPFDDTAIYYTLDGSEPDTTSVRYSTPIIVSNTTNLKAVTAKEGWGISETALAYFKKSTIDYNDILLNKLPAEKFTGAGGVMLGDLQRGSTNFVDGKWLGYEGSHFNATFELDKVQEISSVSVGALSAPGNWIFFPTGFIISVSQDGKRFTRLHKESLRPQKPDSSISLKFFNTEFAKTTAKYVRVEVKSILKNPAWHQNPGGNSWLFVDEIVIN
jgi:uncharacterized membrane protein/mono/diheme cytochrome c family protein